MKPWFSTLLALGVFGPLAALTSGTLSLGSRNLGSAPFIECGGGVSGTPGIVVVHLLDRSPLRSWSLNLEGSTLGPRGLEWAGKGTIRIEISAAGVPWACQASAPSPFHLRSTAKVLAGTTLRVLAREPVRVEIQDAKGRVLAFRTVDPVARQTTTIGW